MLSEYVKINYQVHQGRFHRTHVSQDSWACILHFKKQKYLHTYVHVYIYEYIWNYMYETSMLTFIAKDISLQDI